MDLENVSANDLRETLAKVRRIRRTDGTRRLLARVLRKGYVSLVRDWTPRVEMVFDYNGVAVPMRTPILDPLVPLPVDRWARNRPDYERVETAAVRRKAREGDDVVVIGGGVGVTAVAAAKRVGPAGSVVVYEASAKSVDKIREVIECNDVADRVTVRHAVVGDVVALDSLDSGFGGQADEATVVAPEDLPDADLYELDCEGAEAEILSAMTVRPSTVVVETHAMFDVPKTVTAAILTEREYEIEETVPNGEGCHVLVASYEGEGHR